jgi:hypothetical protein
LKSASLSSPYLIGFCFACATPDRSRNRHTICCGVRIGHRLRCLQQSFHCLLLMTRNPPCMFG